MTLLVTPHVMNELSYLYSQYGHEIGMFGQLAEDTDKLLVEKLWVPSQEVSSGSIDFDDEGVASVVDQAFQQGVDPWRLRVWMHTHPGMGPTPSKTDWETFDESFSNCDWAIMAILGKNGQWSVTLRQNVLPHFQGSLTVEVDWSSWTPGNDLDEIVDQTCREKVWAYKGTGVYGTGVPQPLQQANGKQKAKKKRETFQDGDDDPPLLSDMPAHRAMDQLPIDPEDPEDIQNVLALRQMGWSEEEIAWLLESGTP